MNIYLSIHLFSCWFMTGAIWLVQVLIYPNFRIIGQTEFKNFHKFHLNRITWVVAPFMVLELVTALWLALNFQTFMFYLNLVSVLTLWGLTALLNVPSHQALNFESDTSKTKLIRSNWPRTIIWSARSIFLVWLLHPSLNGVLK